MPAARDDQHISDDDPDLDLTPPQRLRAFAELMAIGLQRLRERPHDALDSDPIVASFPAVPPENPIR